MKSLLTFLILVTFSLSPALAQFNDPMPMPSPDPYDDPIHETVPDPDPDPPGLSLDRIEIENRLAAFGVFQTVNPNVQIFFKNPNNLPLQDHVTVWLDDGYDETLDEIDVTSRFSFSSDSMIGQLPETAFPSEFSDASPESLQHRRFGLDDTDEFNVIYHGENRLRVYLDSPNIKDVYFLTYQDDNQVVIGTNEGTELIPGEEGAEMLTNHLLIDFDLNASNEEISNFLRENELRPQGIAAEYKTIQVRPLMDHVPEELEELATELDQRLGRSERSVGLDPVYMEGVARSGTLTDRLKNKYDPAKEGFTGWHFDNYHHFVLGSFQSHSLVKQLKGNNTVTAMIYDTGFGLGGAQMDLRNNMNARNKWYIQGSRFRRPIGWYRFQQGAVTQIRLRNPLIRNPQNPGTLTRLLADGYLTPVPDLRPGFGHGTGVANVFGADGIGDINFDGPPDHDEAPMLGTAPDARIRVLGNSNQSNYLMIIHVYGLARTVNDAEIFTTSCGYYETFRPALTNQQVRNIKNVVGQMAASGKLIVLLTHNQNRLLNRSWITSLAPNKNTSRIQYANAVNNQFRPYVLSVGGSNKVTAFGEHETVWGNGNFGSNYGPYMNVIAPAHQVPGLSRDAKTAAMSGTSFATPLVAGIAANLMLVDANLKQVNNIPKVAEYIEATGDKIFYTRNNINRETRRANAWKATLAAANGGLSTQGGRAAAANGHDSFFRYLPLKNAADTDWYGLEIRTVEKFARFYLRDNAGQYTLITDANQNRPAIPGAGANDVLAYVRTQTYRSNNKVLPSIIHTKNHAENFNVPNGTNRYYLARFSIEKNDLVGKTLVGVRHGGVHTVAADRFLEISFNEANWRNATPAEIEVYDDFVFHFKLDNFALNTGLARRSRTFQVGAPFSVDAGESGEINARSTLLSGEIHSNATASSSINLSTIKMTWTKLAGPGEVQFSHLHSLDSMVNFNAPGQYILQLKGERDGFTVTDQVEIDVLAGAFPSATGFEKFKNIFNPAKGDVLPIQYSLLNTGQHTLTLYDRLGREITEFRNDVRASGTYTINWDGRNSDGTRVASDYYILVLKVGSHISKKKIVVLK